MNTIKNCRIYFDKFKAYHLKHPAWGSLHIILDDDNLEDRSVEFCVNYASDNKDFEGKELAELLLRMSKSQRAKISKEC